MRHFIEYEDHILVFTLADGERDQERDNIAKKVQRMYPYEKIEISNVYVKNLHLLKRKSNEKVSTEQIKQIFDCTYPVAHQLREMIEFFYKIEKRNITFGYLNSFVERSFVIRLRKKNFFERVETYISMLYDEKVKKTALFFCKKLAFLKKRWQLCNVQ